MTRKEYQKIKHSAKYINWRKEAEIIEVSKKDYAIILADIRKNLKRIVSIEEGKTLRRVWGDDVDNVFDEYVPVRKRRKVYEIYTKQNGKFIIYTTSRKGKTIEYPGGNAFAQVRDRFIDRTNLGREAFSKAFGTSPYDLRDLTPDSIFYCNPFYRSLSADRLNIITASSIDGCSQYPTALCGLLPTMKESKVEEGTVKPTKEYPFAIGLKSGFIAVYNEFDTHDWLSLRYAPWLYTEDHKDNYNKQLEYLVNPDADRTLLMKASDYSLKPEMEYFFNLKETCLDHESAEYKAAKMVLNAFIGMLHQFNPKAYEKHPYNHLAIIAIARANNNLIKQLNRINVKDILHVCVDGIIYKGTNILGVPDRKLGNFEQEFSGAKIVIRCNNVYLAKKDNEVAKYKHGGYDIYASTGKEIDDDPPTDFKQLFDFTTYKIDSLYTLDPNYKIEYIKNKI